MNLAPQASGPRTARTVTRATRSITYLAAATLVVVASIAAVPAETIFDMIPVPYPGSFPSVGYQATQTHELGDHVAFAGVDRDLYTVVVSLTDWACENDYDLVAGVWVPNRAGTDACVTTPGSSFDHPITLNIYEVDNTGAFPAVGPLIISKTATFPIPFRPSWDSANCTGAGETPGTDVPFGGRWYDPVLGACVHGFASNITFDFSSDGIVLPDEVVYGVAYNTQTWGANPIGGSGPYNSLNFSLDPDNAPSIGTDVEDDTVFFDTSTAAWYCDGGAGGVHVFRRDAGCWAPYVPVVQFNTPPVGACCTDGPGTESECIIARQADCEAIGGLYLGDGTDCGGPLECTELAVTLESFSAEMTGRGVSLSWTTATEVDTVGFRVLRETRSTRQKTLTVLSSMIPAAGTGVSGATYQFLDNAKQATPEAVYFLEDVDLYGRVTRHGPIEVQRGATRSASRE